MCTPKEGITEYGFECVTACEKYGQHYNWCKRSIPGRSWGGCTHPSLIQKAAKHNKVREYS